MQRSSVEKAEAARDLWVHKPITRGMTPYAWVPSFVSGEWLAYLSTESGKSEVDVRPFPDVESAKRQVSLSGGRTPMWAHSSKGFCPDDSRALVLCAAAAALLERHTSAQALPNPRMQPTGRGGPERRTGAALLEAKQWKRRFVWAVE